MQGDFIPTMSLGIPGDAVMALLLGALMIHGIQPGPRLIVEQPDILRGLIYLFWDCNVILVVLNMPMIELWVRPLSVPYGFLYPTALFFVCIGVFAAGNGMLDMGATLLFGAFGHLLLQLGFEPAPILLGFVLAAAGGKLPPRRADRPRQPDAVRGTVHAHIFGRPMGAIGFARSLALARQAGAAWLTGHDTLGRTFGA